MLANTQGWSVIIKGDDDDQRVIIEGDGEDLRHPLVTTTITFPPR